MRGSLLKVWRSSLGITQETAAELLGISRRGMVNRELDDVELTNETLFSCAYISQRRREGCPLEVSGLEGVAASIVHGKEMQIGAEYAGRFQKVLALMNEKRRGGGLSSAKLAYLLGLKKAGDLGKYFLGNDEPTFDFLDQFAARFGVRADWLKFGQGSVFYIAEGCGYEPFDFFRIMSDWVESWGASGISKNDTTLFFLRSRSEEGESCMVCRLPGERYLVSPILNHVSGHVGATGERQLCDLHALILKLRDGEALGRRTLVGGHLDAKEFRSLIWGDVFPGNIVDNLKHDFWWDDFGDLCNDKGRIGAYGPGFLDAVSRVRSVIAFRKYPKVG